MVVDVHFYGPLERPVGIPAAGLARACHAYIPDQTRRLILGENARSLLRMD